MRAPNTERMILERLVKAVTTDQITAVVPEDLEIEAHNTLWEESDPTELTLLKLLPSVPATSIVHEYTRITSYGFRRNSGFFGEQALPPETNFGSERITNDIKLMGEIGPTFLLAALEKTQRGLGTTGAQNIERVALRRNVLWKKNINTYFSDTRTDGSGSTLRFEGLFQLIEEGTDGTTGTSIFGSHVIDLEGQPLSIDSIRDKVGKAIVQFGRFSCMLMDPLSRADLEASLDPAHRLPIPNPISAYMIGQSVGGIQTQGGVTYFETDNALSPVYSRPFYNASLIDGAPTGTPTVVAAAQADDSTTDTVTSKWDADSAGDVFYVVTEMETELEGTGKQEPVGAFLTVAVGQEVELTLTPSSASVTSFKVYRAQEDDGAVVGDLTGAAFIFEVANVGGGAKTAFDNNLYRPNTAWAFGLNIVSQSEQALHSAPSGAGTLTPYEHARARSSEFLRNADNPRNTVAMASLGPTMGILALASVLAEVDRPLVYSACTPEVRNPFQNFVFVNIGRSA